MKIDKKVKTIIGWLLAIVIMAFLVRLFYNNRAELARWQWDINWFKAIISAILLFAAYISAAIAWKTIIYGFGHKVGLSDAFRIVYLANLGRYIPGKVWQVFGMVALANEVGVPARISLASFALAQAYSLPASFVLIPIFLGNIESFKSLALYKDLFYLAFAISFLAFLILFFKPGGLSGALNWVLKVLKREPVDYRPKYKNRIAIFNWYLITWILFGLAFHYFLEALLANSILPLKYAVGTYIAAYIIGYISFLSPGGLGFREGVMTALLTPFLGVGTAVSVSLIHRLWITFAEVIISLISLLTYKFGSKKPFEREEPEEPE